MLIYLIKQRPLSVIEKVNGLPEEAGLCMSFVTWAELLKGAELSQQAARVQQQLSVLAQQVRVRFPDSATICQHYARHAAQLRKAGTPIGGNDLWIAAHALADNCILVTNNEREFCRVDGLVVENWV